MKKYTQAALFAFAITTATNLCIAGPTPFWDWAEPDAPEFVAAQKGNLSVVQQFVEEGKGINRSYIVWPANQTLIYAALKNKHWQIVTYLLSRGARVKGLYGWEALPFLVLCRRINAPREMIKKLIEAGADVPPLASDKRQLLSQLFQSESGRWLPQLLQKLVQADSSIDEAWLRSSVFLHAFVTLGKTERKVFIKRLLQEKEIPDDLIRLIASFWQE